MSSMDGRAAPADRVRVVVSDVLELPVGAVTEETSRDNTPQWDSLRAISLVLALEQEFGVRLSTKEMVSARTVGIVRQLLRARGITDV